MAEEPEQVLEEDRITAAGGIEELVPKWRSVSSMVTAPASTGIVAISRKAVISQPQAKSGSFIIVMPGARRLKMVTMMLIEPRIEETPRM
jgi:hypothetical protein